MTFIFLIYVLVKIREIPESLSSTYYLLGSRGWLFQMYIAFLTIALFPVWFSVTGESLKFLSFLACSALIFVSSAPQFRLRVDGIVHYGAAAIGGLCAVLWLLLTDNSWSLVMSTPLLVPIFLLPKKYMLFLEIAIIFALELSLLAYILR